MAKSSYYFSHDYGARNDPKLVKVLMRLGQEGKGVYWDIIEMLYEQDGYLMLSDCDSYAFALRVDEDCIRSLINDFGLFENDGEKFWSKSVLSRLKKRDEKSNVAKENALKRWNKADVDAKAMQPHSKSNVRLKDSNAIKESKVKENKEKYSFDNFWIKYPVKKSKRDAEAKWNKLSEADKEKIMETLPVFICEKPFDSYQHPNPTTYLNQRRWEDEITPKSNTGAPQRVYTPPTQITIEH